ncbi:UbiA prenyltransferase family [Mycena vulgaris]|nr:UbiA prenyltransferase family [Mycena vulgaris]
MSQPKLISSFGYFAWTLFLFTYTDFKTIVFPVTLFACAAAPIQSAGRLLYAMAWVWLNLLEADVSNQYKSMAEDLKNHAWRPLPGGRISQESATLLHWVLVPLCVLASLPFGRDVVCCSLTLTGALIAYNEYGWARNWMAKNLVNTIGYASFEFGATKIMNGKLRLDHIALRSLTCSALVVLTTIHAQDFSDIEGDMAAGRVTLPIYAPKGARITPPSRLASGLGTKLLLVVLGGTVGWRFYKFRTVAKDQKTYVAYNIWLLLVHVLSLHARWGVFRL